MGGWWRAAWCAGGITKVETLDGGRSVVGRAKIGGHEGDRRLERIAVWTG